MHMEQCAGVGGPTSDPVDEALAALPEGVRCTLLSAFADLVLSLESLKLTEGT